GVAGQEDERGVEFFSAAETSVKRARNDRAGDVIAFELVRHLGFEIAGRERIHANSPAASPLLGQVAGEADETGFGRRIGSLGRPRRGQTEDAGDVDDRAARLHYLCARLSHPIAAVQVDVDYRSELFRGFPGGRNSG